MEMALWQKGVLLLTGLIAIYMIKFFADQQKSEDTAGTFNLYYIVSFAVLLVAGLLLIFFGWKVLEHPFVAVVAGLIPFSLAIGLITQFYPEYSKNVLIFFVIGLVLITINKFGNPDATWGKIVYPVFHAIAGFTIFFLPLFASKAGKAPAGFYNVTIGGTIIGIGGLALAYEKVNAAGLFGIFDINFIILILAPVLFLTALFFMLGFTKK